MRHKEELSDDETDQDLSWRPSCSWAGGGGGGQTSQILSLLEIWNMHLFAGKGRVYLIPQAYFLLTPWKLDDVEFDIFI